MDTSHRINERISDGYDRHPWFQEYPNCTRAAALNQLARTYGCSRTFCDVLDLGCGTGALLAAAGSDTTGRLVGTDISKKSCELARIALSRLQDRAEIVNSDILALNGDSLGRFDLIYCTGVLHVVPVDVREHILQLIGQCLRPGGAALISYFTGSEAAVRAHLAKTLRSFSSSGNDTLEQINTGRRVLDHLRSSLRRQGRMTLALRAAFRYLDNSSDDLFFAENLNGACEAVSTAQITSSLKHSQVEFATYLNYLGFKPAYSPENRALLADRLDLTAGGYRYAMFVKRNVTASSTPDEVPAPDSYPVSVNAGRTSAQFYPRRLLRRLFWQIFRV